jgi:hypothetical protein
MLLTQNYRPRTSHQHYQQPLQNQQPRSPTCYPSLLDLDTSFDESADVHSAAPSLSSSPLSQYSIVPQSAYSTINNLPAIAIPCDGGASTDDIALGIANTSDPMHNESWLGGHFTPKSAGRTNHHRESSLSSLGSAGPASPYTANLSNPHIAVTDSGSDGFHDLHGVQDNSWNYQMVPKSMPLPHTHDHLYGAYHPYTPIDNSPSDMGYPRQRTDRGGLLPTPDFQAPTRSHPGSVASSTIGGDSPATPSLGEPEDDRRRKAVFNNVPKLDRTMTDVYSDELYSPNFTITSSAPSQTHLAASPTNDLFAQRLQAANSQHLSVAHSPVSGTSRGHSPFRQGSPLAPAPSHDFSSGLPSRVQFNSAQRMREQNAMRADTRIMKQQMATRTDHGTPQTISPKDSVLDLPDETESSNFPLFPHHESGDFDVDQLTKTDAPDYERSPDDNGGAFHYLPSQLPTGIPVPQQYPFIAHNQQAESASPRLSSAGSSSVVSSSTPTSSSKPSGALADGGTYTCTYHGCTLRFDTPALLQKHKREGHRQAHGLSTVRRSDVGLTTSLINSQAGPHRCDRINPSTGKPCNTVFSRPYDLTRHEDTIHNARKQKVRCDLCTEEKTFSRADALTRHYRVCHPDVEFPGKHRRRGGQV